MMIQELEFFPQPEPEKNPQENKKKTILIAEDDECQMEILEYRFKENGFDVLRADSGHKAEEMAKYHMPDVILMDVDLPDRSGMETCRQLTDHEKTSDIPVVILSGSTDADIVRQSRAAGSSFFLHKPFDPTALLILVNQAIDQSQDWT